MRAALGFRDHSGWAIAVALAGDAIAPEFVLRERIELLPAELPRQVYHAVGEQGAPRELIAEVRDAALTRTRAELVRMRGLLEKQSLAVGCVAVAEGRAAIPGSLDRILASHTLLHAAEGELYRDVLTEAAATLGLNVVRFVQRDVFTTAGLAAGLNRDEVEHRLVAMGKPLGPPWQKDHREAAAAAWLALATLTNRTVR